MAARLREPEAAVSVARNVVQAETALAARLIAGEPIFPLLPLLVAVERAIVVASLAGTPAKGERLRLAGGDTEAVRITGHVLSPLSVVSLTCGKEADIAG
jgi:hypothetical protein